MSQQAQLAVRMQQKATDISSINRYLGFARHEGITTPAP